MSSTLHKFIIFHTYVGLVVGSPSTNVTDDARRLQARLRKISHEDFYGLGYGSSKLSDPIDNAMEN